MLQEYINQLKLEGFSKNSVKGIISVFSCALNYAIEPLGYLQVNPCDRVKYPVFEKKMRERIIISSDDFEKIIKRFPEGNPFYLPLMIGYYTGLRIGEMIALKWKYVNLEKKYIRVEFSFTNNLENKPFGYVDPKTENSIRVVELDDELVEQLKKHYEEERKIYGFNEEYLVFGNVKHIAPTTFRRYLNKYIKKANIKRITPHGFRHSHVSLLINLGCDSRDVAERIGDTVEVVEKTYYHMFPEKKKIPVNKLNTLKIRGNYEVNDIQTTKKAEDTAFYT